MHYTTIPIPLPPFRYHYHRRFHNTTGFHFAKVETGDFGNRWNRKPAETEPAEKVETGGKGGNGIGIGMVVINRRKGDRTADRWSDGGQVVMVMVWWYGRVGWWMRGGTMNNNLNLP